MEPRDRVFPVGYRFRPTYYEMANYFLRKKALRLPMKARNIPEECPDIFFTHPHDLPGNPREREDHWYFYCRKINKDITNHSHNLWKPIGEESDVLNPENNDELVGIKRSFAFVENTEYDSNGLSDEEAPPKYNWFMDEISLPSTVVDTDWVLCHVFCQKVPEFADLPESESEEEKEEENEEEKEEEEEEEESVDKPAESLDIFSEKDENVLPPPPDSP